MSDALTVDEVLDRIVIIPDYDPGGGPGPCVHTIVVVASAAIGAHWRVKDVVDELNDGATATPTTGPAGHDIALELSSGRLLYLETKP